MLWLLRGVLLLPSLVASQALVEELLSDSTALGFDALSTGARTKLESARSTVPVLDGCRLAVSLLGSSLSFSICKRGPDGGCHERTLLIKHSVRYSALYFQAITRQLVKRIIILSLTGKLSVVRHFCVWVV